MEGGAVRHNFEMGPTQGPSLPGLVEFGPRFQRRRFKCDLLSKNLHNQYKSADFIFSTTVTPLFCLFTIYCQIVYELLPFDQKYGELIVVNFFPFILFSSPDPKGHVSYCHHWASGPSLPGLVEFGPRFQRRRFKCDLLSKNLHNQYKSAERKISQKNPEYMLNYSLPCSCR
jgi:hypothetical protein